MSLATRWTCAEAGGTRKGRWDWPGCCYKPSRGVKRMRRGGCRKSRRIRRWLKRAMGTMQRTNKNNKRIRVLSWTLRIWNAPHGKAFSTEKEFSRATSPSNDCWKSLKICTDLTARISLESTFLLNLWTIPCTSGTWNLWTLKTGTSLAIWRAWRKNLATTTSKFESNWKKICTHITLQKWPSFVHD